MQRELRVHITPNDYSADIDEIPDGSEPRSRCRLFIEPSGPFGINEVCDANYYIGNRVPYHEHTSGFETFLVDGGAIEVLTRSRRAVAHVGDIVHLTPYTPHSIHVLEDNSIWRAFHQGMYIVRGMIEDRKLRDMYPEIYSDLEFKKEIRLRNNKSVWHDYLLPECADVPVGEIPEIRTFDFGFADFDLGGIRLKLKVGRWETNGAKEVWQLHLKSGYQLAWTARNTHTLLYDVSNGSVEVQIDGMDTITAKTRDLLHIPKFVAGSITALEDTVLLDCGCQGFLMRFMDELQAYKVREPAKLKDKSFMSNLMKKHDYHVFFEL